MGYAEFLKAYAAALVASLIKNPHERLIENHHAFLRNLPGDCIWQDIVLPICDFAADLIVAGTLSESDGEDFVPRSCLDLDLKTYIENAIRDRQDDIERAVDRELREIANQYPDENPLHDLRQSEFNSNRRSA